MALETFEEMRLGYREQCCWCAIDCDSHDVSVICVPQKLGSGICEMEGKETESLVF
jgi:hypothetical protein